MSQRDAGVVESFFNALTPNRLRGSQDAVSKPKNLFLVGRPGVGKTTLLVKVAERLTDLRIGGFFTREVREGTKRVGFRVETFSGATGILACVVGKHGPRVGKYVVDTAEFERVGVAGLEDAIQAADVIFIDEIGKMELFSQRFRVALVRALDCRKPVLATVMAYPDPFVDGLKTRPDALLIAVTESNRDRLVDELAAQIRALSS